MIFVGGGKEWLNVVLFATIALTVEATLRTDKPKPMDSLVPATIIPVECMNSEMEKPLALWFESTPYAYWDKLNENHTINTKPNGIVGDMLTLIMKSCCKESTTLLNYEKEVNVTPSTADEIQRDVVYGIADIALPLLEPTRTTLKGSFIKVVPSPGAVYLVKDAYKSPSLLKAVSGAWLLLVFVIAAAAVAGIIMWLSEHRVTDSDFGYDIIRGIFNGFWWAIVTMTTVGFGDSVPSTYVGRMMALIWMIVGLILVTLFTATVTTSLTTATLNEDTTLRGARVAVVANSAASRLAVINGANITVEAATAVDAVKALHNGTCQGVVLDQMRAGYLVTEGGPLMVGLRLAKLLMDESDYGILLNPNRSISHINQCADLVVQAKQREIYISIEEFVNALETKRYSVQPATSVSDILGQHKNVVYVMLMILGATIMLGLVYHAIYGRKINIDLRRDQRGRFPSYRSTSNGRMHTPPHASTEDMIATYPPMPKGTMGSRFRYGAFGSTTIQTPLNQQHHASIAEDGNSISPGSTPGNSSPPPVFDQPLEGSLDAVLQRHERELQQLEVECTNMLARWSQSHRQLIERHRQEREKVLKTQ